MRGIFGIIPGCVGSFGLRGAIFNFPSVSATETLEFLCLSDMSRANALYFDVSQAMHRVLYRVVDVCQFCVESFGVSFAVAIWHAFFFCNAKCIGFYYICF